MSSEEYVRKAYQCILQNDFEAAIRFFEKAIEADPHHPEVHYRCSVTYARSHKLDKALEHADQAVKLEPEKKVYQLHVQHLKAMKAVQQARRWLEGPNGPETSDLYQAVQLLKEAIVLDPLYVEAMIWLALAYGQLNEYSLAIATIKEAILLHPEDDQLTRLLEKLKLELHDYMKK